MKLHFHEESSVHVYNVPSLKAAVLESSHEKYVPGCSFLVYFYFRSMGGKRSYSMFFKKTLF